MKKPISPHGEIGRRRPRLDISIHSGEKPVCPKFVFEAKRLRCNDTEAKDYFGSEGIQRFWNETCYPVYAFREAGMLGYIQDNDATHWSCWLKKHFEKRKIDLHICECSGWDPVVQIKQLQNTYCTQHQPKANEEVIVIYHQLLLFSKE